jgi:hypothetical protein
VEEKEESKSLELEFRISGEEERGVKDFEGLPDVIIRDRDYTCDMNCPVSIVQFQCLFSNSRYNHARENPFGRSLFCRRGDSFCATTCIYRYPKGPYFLAVPSRRKLALFALLPGAS